MSINHAGINREYLQGVAHLREQIDGVEKALTQNKASFYNGCGDTQHLSSCNGQLKECNNKLKAEQIQPEIIDSELKIISLLNNLRSVSAGNDCISFVTEMWESIKLSVECLKTLGSRFQTSVLIPLQKIEDAHDGYLTTSELQGQLMSTYKASVLLLMREMVETNKNLVLLLHSYGNKMVDLASPYVEEMGSYCDASLFPLILLVPSAFDSIIRLCQTARQYLDCDENYVQDITKCIRETQHKTKSRETVLKKKQDQYRRIAKNCKMAQILLKKNNEKLTLIEKDLHELETMALTKSLDKGSKSEEKVQKETMLDFLQLSVTQTKRKTTLRLKRQRLIRQIRALEDQLQQIAEQLGEVQKQMLEKSQEKMVIVEKIQTGRVTHRDIKLDLDRFAGTIDKLQGEVNDLSGQLDQLQILQTLKQCPERVDEFYERPSTVKLSPSLMEKIKVRRKKQRKTLTV